ncbi:MAG: hypothetical protein ABH854_01125 [Candidatus Diapherotrites archaeon]
MHGTKRQAIHLLLGLLFIYLALSFGRAIALQAAVVIFIAGSVLSFLILHGLDIPLINRILGNVQRQREQGKLPGISAMYFVLGVAITLFVFPLQAAVAGLMVLTFGDTTATLAGGRFGRHKTIGERTVEGTAAGIAAAFIALLFLTTPLNAAIVACAGMLAEYLPIDDSYSIPAVAGLVMLLLI